MGINFPMRCQRKISPTKALMYPRHFFVDREVKNIKGSWERLPTKFDVLKVYYYTSKTKQLQVIEIMGKIKFRLKRSVKSIYIVEI